VSKGFSKAPHGEVTERRTQWRRQDLLRGVKL